MAERATTFLDLPITEQKAEVITYFTRGETQEIQKVIFSKSTVGADGKPSIDMLATIDSNNRALELAVKNMTMQQIDDLPVEDARVIEEYVNSLSTPKKK